MALKVDGYKFGHWKQYVKGTQTVQSDFTPRSNKLAQAVQVLGKTDAKMPVIGTQMAIQMLVEYWDQTFFSVPKRQAIRDVLAKMGHYIPVEHIEGKILLLAKLWDIQYLPLRISTIAEGSMVNMQTPIWYMTNVPVEGVDNEDLKWLVNYNETFISQNVWPVCNAAALMQMYYQNAKKYISKTADEATAALWLPIACHNFAARGHRGDQDAAMSGLAAAIFSVGSDTADVLNYAEKYYDAPVEGEGINQIICSVNAFEHATATQRIAFFGGELPAMQDMLSNLYPTGILAYVADSNDYFRVLRDYLPQLKPLIEARTPDKAGMPPIFTVRPDSSPKTPKEIILGDCYIVNEDITNLNYVVEKAKDSGYKWIRYWDTEDQKQYYLSLDKWAWYDEDSPEVPDEVKGSLEVMKEAYGDVTLNDKGYMVLPPTLKLIYGEAITLRMQQEIYEGLILSGWCVSNVLMGVGSWAFLENASRDSWGMAIKGTNSTVLRDGEVVEVPMQKAPVTAMDFKKSQKGRIRVDWDEETQLYVTSGEQTEETEGGLLEVVWEAGEFKKRVTLDELRAMLAPEMIIPAIPWDVDEVLERLFPNGELEEVTN